jgi:hypothetical protein
LTPEVAATLGRQDATTKAQSRPYIVGNETARPIEVRSRDGSTLTLAPLEERAVSPEDFRRFTLSRWSGLIAVRTPDQITPAPEHNVVIMTVGFFIWFAVIWGVLAAFFGAPMWWKLGWLIAAAVALVAWVVDRVRTHPGEVGMEGDVGALARPKVFVRQLLRWVGQQFYLVVSLLIGIVLPGAAIFFASDGLNLFRELRDHGVADHAVVLTVIGRVMQVVFVAVASLLPALLYFLFDREHLQTLRQRFVRQIMRFDPTVPTRSAVFAKYKKLMEEAYGSGGRILPGRRSPILLASLLIALGWTFTLLHGDVKVIGETGISGLFEPRLTAVSFAFLGSYFFGLNAILRGYLRRDLRPKTYSTFTVRVIVVVVLAWVIELIWKDETLFVLAFLAGIIPDTALVLIKESLAGLGRRFTAIEEEQDPLTRLEGIDLYDRARLFDEGVTNVEGLAHHDVVDLMLQTRIPVPRIVDWLDQAVLYLHAGPRETEGDGLTRTANLTRLRAYGIRTATDVDNAIDGAKDDAQRESILRILGPADGAPRLQVIRQTMTDDEWAANLRHWRKDAIPNTRRLVVRTPPSPG